MYRTVLKADSFEEEIKKSKFITRIQPVKTEDEAILFIDKIKELHRDATHNCSAYMIGSDGLIQRYDDDGEPSKTAGIPILEMIKSKGITNVAIVVTRYFGGIKLGAGGLIRAYASGANHVIEKAKIIDMLPFYKVKIDYNYTLHGILENFFLTNGYPIDNPEFTDKVCITTVVQENKLENFKSNLNEITSANHKLQVLEKNLFPVLEGKLIYKGKYYEQ